VRSCVPQNNESRFVLPLCAVAVMSHRALVVAAELSDRYITARFLPDKVSGEGEKIDCFVSSHPINAWWVEEQWV
jgi:hypothetical protein